MFRRRHGPPEPEDLTASLEQRLRAVGSGLRRMKALRDEVVMEAQAHGLSTREIAKCAGLSPSLVHRITKSAVEYPPSSRQEIPVRELELKWGPSRAQEIENPDLAARIVALADVAPDLATFPTPQAFQADNPDRAPGKDCSHYDLCVEIFDGALEPRWLVSYVDATGEVYGEACDDRWRDPLRPERELDPPLQHGPVIVLGRLPSHSPDLAIAFFHPAIYRVQKAVGGLAWVYGRLCLAQRVLKEIDRYFLFDNGRDPLFPVHHLKWKRSIKERA